MSKDWIQTSRGEKFFPLRPTPESVHIEDIAHALSNLCRYTGHCSRFYSVGEHSVRVSRRVLELTGDARLSLWGLLHDASEAYICDIARPVKHQPELAPYREAEARLQAVIIARFGLPAEEPAVVKQADLELLSTEATHLMQPLHPDWVATMPGGMCPLPLRAGEHLGWSPTQAKQIFLNRFQQLLGRVDDESISRVLEMYMEGK